MASRTRRGVCIRCDQDSGPSDHGGRTTIEAVTSPEVATVDFEQLNGEVITIEPTDLTGRFDVGFIFVAVDVPEAARPDANGLPPSCRSFRPSLHPTLTATSSRCSPNPSQSWVRLDCQLEEAACFGGGCVKPVVFVMTDVVGTTAL